MEVVSKFPRAVRYTILPQDVHMDRELVSVPANAGFDIKCCGFENIIYRQGYFEVHMTQNGHQFPIRLDEGRMVCPCPRRTLPCQHKFWLQDQLVRSWLARNACYGRAITIPSDCTWMSGVFEDASHGGERTLSTFEIIGQLDGPTILQDYGNRMFLSGFRESLKIVLGPSQNDFYYPIHSMALELILGWIEERADHNSSWRERMYSKSPKAQNMLEKCQFEALRRRVDMTFARCDQEKISQDELLFDLKNIDDQVANLGTSTIPDVAHEQIGIMISLIKGVVDRLPRDHRLGLQPPFGSFLEHNSTFAIGTLAELARSTPQAMDRNQQTTLEGIQRQLAGQDESRKYRRYRTELNRLLREY